MQRRLQEVRQQKPDADYASIVGDFDAILGALIDQRTLIAFADKYGFPLSKRLIDAEIAQIPGDQGPQRPVQRAGLPAVPRAAAADRSPGPADPRRRAAAAAAADAGRDQCARLGRDGDALCLDAARIARGRGGDRPDRRVQGRAQADRRRPSAILYRQPQPLHGPGAAGAADRAHRAGAGRRASPRPTRKSPPITTATRRLTRRRKRATSARSWSPTRRPPTPSRRARRAATLAAAAAPAGANAAVTSLKDQTRAGLCRRRRRQGGGGGVLRCLGAVVGPVQSDFGWVVAKVDFGQGRRRQDARAGARRDRRQAQRRQAQERDRGPRRQGPERARRWQQLHRGGRPPPKLPVDDDAADHRQRSVARRPDVQAARRTCARAQDRLRYRAERSARDRLAAERPGLCRSSRPAQVVPAAPAPLASIREQVANDWINDQATQRAQAVADADCRQGERGEFARRGDEGSRRRRSRRCGRSPHAESRSRWRKARSRRRCKMLFTLAQGKSRMAPDPQGRGFFVVKVDKITPGNALLQPTLIGQMQSELQQSASRRLCARVPRRAAPGHEGQAQRQRDPGAEDADARAAAAEARPGLTRVRFVAYTFPVRSYGE